jgi:hypothetical protein
MLDNKTFTSTEDDKTTGSIKKTTITPKLDTSAEDRQLK